MHGKTIVTALAISAALATGSACGSTAGSTSTAPPKTVTKTVTVTKTPKSCKDALVGMRMIAKLEAAADMLVIRGAQRVDATLIDEATSKIDQATKLVDAVNAPFAACMAG
jgi:hypothetical protein